MSGEEEDDEGTSSSSRRRSKGRTAPETRALKLRVRLLMEQGKTDLEMMEELDVSAHDLKWLRTQLLEDELLEVNDDTPASTWLKYRIAQQGVVRDLDTFIEAGKKPKANAGTQAAAVTALKIKSTIVDSILERGQEFGVIYKPGEDKPKRGGVDVDDLGLEELEDEAAERLRLLQERMDSYGASDYAEEDDGDIYEDEDDDGDLIPLRKRV